MSGLRVVEVTTVPQTLYRLLPTFVRHMQDKGWDVHCVCGPASWLSVQEVVERVGVPVTVATKLSRTLSPSRDFLALLQLMQSIRALRPDVVHLHSPKAGLLGSLAARSQGVDRIVYTVRGLPHITARGWRRKVLVLSERVSCRLADVVIAVSDSVRSEMLAAGIIDRVTDAVVLGSGSGQGVDARSRFAPTPGPRHRKSSVDIGFVGRLARDKGVDDLVRAWAVIRGSIPSARLHIAGPGGEPRDGADPSSIDALTSDPTVRSYGVVDDMPAFYSKLDILLFPSHREGFPNAILEASAMGLPVVGYDAVGTRDAVVHGKTGLLVPLGSHESLADAVLTLCADSEQRAQYGAAARSRALECFNPAEIFAATTELYKSPPLGNSAA